MECFFKIFALYSVFLIGELQTWNLCDGIENCIQNLIVN